MRSMLLVWLVAATVSGVIGGFIGSVFGCIFGVLLLKRVHVFANVSLLGLFYGEWLRIVRDEIRGEYPPWADSLGIPMSWLISAWKHAAPILTFGLVVCLRRARLPAILWQRPVGWWPWTSTLVICGLIALETIVLTQAVQFGEAFAIPGHVAMVYCLLCGRAAVSSRQAAEAGTSAPE